MTLPLVPAPEGQPSNTLASARPEHFEGRGIGEKEKSRFLGRKSTLLALPFGSTPLDSEEGRDFLQRRLTLFSRVVFLLSAFAFVATHLIQTAIPNHDFLTCLREHGGYWHVFAAGISLAVWLTTRRGLLPFRALFAIDVAGTVLAL